MSQAEPLVLRNDRADGLTTLTLNRPNAFNSLSKDLLSALQAELDAIATSDTVRVVVIAGAGKAFCSGHDLKEMRANHSPYRRLHSMTATGMPLTNSTISGR